MSIDSLNEIFNRFNQLKILVIGDVMVDSYLWGGVNRISPEAPVPIVEVDEREKRLGGAANVARNLLELGIKPFLCSVIGNEEEGTNLLKLMNDQGLSAEGIVVSNDRQTTVKHRIIASNQHLLRVDTEDTHDLSDSESSKLLSLIKLLAEDCDAIVFEDYDKGVLNAQLIEEVISFANDKSIPTIVDPKKKNFLSYKNCSLFKPNLKELVEGLKIEVDKSDINTIKEGIRKLMDTLGNEATLLTLSELGVFYMNSEAELHFEAHVRDISDVSGAGDTVVAVAAAAMASKLSPNLVAELSNLAGGLVCEQVGVVPINKNQLLEEANSKL